MGPDHPDVATGLNNLGLVYCDQGKYALAESLYKRSLAIYEENEKAVGVSQFLHVSVSLTNLGLLYHEQGQYAQAEPVLERSLEIIETVLGPDVPDVVGSLENLAALYRATQRDSEAEKLEQRAVGS